MIFETGTIQHRACFSLFYQLLMPLTSPTSSSEVKTENLADRLTNLAESYYQLGMLHVADKTSSILSVGITGFIMLLLAMFVLLFLGLSLGWYFGEQLHNMVAGFLIAAGFYVLLALTTLIFRRSFFMPRIKDIIIRKMHE